MSSTEGCFPNSTLPSTSATDVTLDPNEDDVSKFNFVTQIWTVKKSSTIIIEVSIFLPVVLCGLFGNFLVLYILFHCKHLRTPANLIIGNMAVADFLALLVHPWVFLVTYDFFQNYELGSYGCKGEATVECAMLISSVISLSVISYDRLTSIVLPRASGLNKRRAKIVIFFTWVCSFCLASPLIIYRTYKERQWADYLEKYCSENTLITKIYWPVIIIVLVWIPLTILIICYLSIFVKLKKYEKIIALELNRQVDYKRKAAKMMFIIILTFLICRLPFTAFIFMRYAISKTSTASTQTLKNKTDGIFHTIWFTSKFLMCANCTLNPLLYALTNEKFKRAFKGTKLSNWMFPSVCGQPKIIKKKDAKPKCVENSLVRNNVFFIFKKKNRSVIFNNGSTGVLETKMTPITSNL